MSCYNLYNHIPYCIKLHYIMSYDSIVFHITSLYIRSCHAISSGIIGSRAHHAAGDFSSLARILQLRGFTTVALRAVRLLCHHAKFLGWEHLVRDFLSQNPKPEQPCQPGASVRVETPCLVRVCESNPEEEKSLQQKETLSPLPAKACDPYLKKLGGIRTQRVEGNPTLY